MSTTTATKQKTNQPVKVDISWAKVGDVFSETSHYKLEGKSVGGLKFKHLGTGKTVDFTTAYVEQMLITADQFHSEETVGKEDKHWTAKQIDEAVAKGDLPKDPKLQPREGDVRIPGIRTIWANIYGPDVFTVCFNKADKAKSKRQLQKEKDEQLTTALSKLKGATAATVKSNAAKVIEEIQNNPILDYEAGEERILRGFKVQFSSINGSYDVVDMDLPDTDSAGGRRKVNVNEIKWLIYHGVRYVVE